MWGVVNALCGNGLSARGRASIRLIKRGLRALIFAFKLSLLTGPTPTHTHTHTHTYNARGLRCWKLICELINFCVRDPQATRFAFAYELPLKLKIAWRLLWCNPHRIATQLPLPPTPRHAGHVQHFSTLFRQRWADPRVDCEMCQFGIKADDGESVQWEWW